MTFGRLAITPATYSLMAELSIDFFTVPCSCKTKTSTKPLTGILFIKSPSTRRTLLMRRLHLLKTLEGDKVTTNHSLAFSTLSYMEK